MESLADYERFLVAFGRSRGGLEILVVTTLLSLGIGVTVALIPGVATDRYARLHFDYSGPPCDLFDKLDKPLACQAGSDQAQEASTWSNVALCVALLLCNPVIASLSDSNGRRKVILYSLSLAILPAVVFSMLLYIPEMNPFWYYAANSVAGSINLLSLVFAALADVMPADLLAPAMGLVMSGFYGGFALGPTCATLMSPLDSSLLSTALLVMAVVFGALFIPETRPQEETPNDSAIVDMADPETLSHCSLKWLYQTATRPLRDVSILNRNWTLRLLTAGSFFSAMVFAADSTLVLYYIENTLGVQTNDLAQMFLVLGVFGIVSQAGLLQPLSKAMGDKHLLVATFFCGVCHNLVYGIAKTKYGITLAFVMSQLTKLNFPLLSSLASRGASAQEQGRVQGALFATNAIANAIGPLIMEFIYRRTKDSSMGPGFMWIFAAFLYFVGAVLVSQIPIGGEGFAHQSQDGDCLSATESQMRCSDARLLLVDVVELGEPLLESAFPGLDEG